MCKLLKWWTSIFYGFPSLLPPSTLPYPDKSELFPGVTKPSTTLAHMLVAEMLSNLHLTNRLGGHNDEFPKYVFPSFTAYVYISGGVFIKWMTHPYVKDSSVIFDAAELKILEKGLMKFRELSKKSLDIRKEAERQQAAIDAIAAMLPKPDLDLKTFNEAADKEEFQREVTTLLGKKVKRPILVTNPNAPEHWVTGEKHG